MSLALLGGSAGISIAAAPANQSAEAAASERSTRVEERLQSRLGEAAADISVEDRRESIVLSGSVDILPEKAIAVEAAQSVRGVQEVVDRLEVRGEQRPDADIARDVKWSLNADPATFGLDVDATVNDGVVTLRGAVETVPQRRIADWVASGIRGVREVRNEIAVPREERSDREIHQQLVQHFQSSPVFNDDEIEVSVDYGVIQLSGHVDSALEKNWAQGDAWVRGARQVNADALEIRYTPALQDGKNLPILTDAAIRQAIVEGLIYDPRVGSLRIDVDVADGKVTLAGAVANRQAKQAAVQIARATGGVTDVVDRLEVRADHPRGDEAIAQDLQKALENSAALVDQEIQAEVEDGRARLTGTVESQYEKWVAGNLADRTAGVTDVRNDLLIAGAGGVRDTAYYFFPDGSMYTPWIYPENRGEKPKPDEQLEADVRRELALSPFTDESEIEVAADDGTVILKGEVPSWPVRGAAIDNAYQAGAHGVIDNLRVVSSR